MQAYGLTETSGGVVLLYPDDHDPGGPLAHRLRAAGRPVPGVEVQIVGADGAVLPAGEIGEVWIRSPSTMIGYWNKPDATADALTADGWFRSGDAGRLDDDGYLYIEDRVKDMIISGGENVYPAEVESVLMGNPSVADAAVVGSIIDLARTLGLRVVAEGVEDESTRAMLLDRGCEVAQGWLYARPMPADDLVSWLAHHR